MRFNGFRGVGVLVGTMGVASACSDSPSQPTAEDPNISIAAMYVVQAVQTLDRSVPVIASREAYLRVFPRSDQANTATPLRVRLFQGSSLLSSTDYPLDNGPIPTEISQASNSGNWTIHLPAAVVQPGLRIEAELDPNGSMEEPNESDNTATLQVAVHTAPPLRLRLVPIHQPINGLTGAINQGNKDTFLSMTRKIFPIAELDADVRSAYTVDGPAFDPGGTVWTAIVNELDAVRVAEGTGRYYYGVVRTEYPGGGVVGIAAGIPSRTALGWDRFPDAPNTVAHELGHNFGRRHVPCGGAAGNDPQYPYPTGMIGSFGMDTETRELKTPTEYTDIMGYCDASWWISDYTFTNVLNYRAQADAGLSISGGQGNALLVWGRIVDGEPILEPAFRIVTRPALPQGPGPYRLEALAEDGTRLFQISFAGERLEDAPGDQRIFSFAIPLDAAAVSRLATLRLTADGRTVSNRVASTAAAAGIAQQRVEPFERYSTVERGDGRVALQWDATAHPAVMVRDARTGDVLSIARGGSAVVLTSAAELELIASDGVASTTERVRVGTQ